LKSSIHVGIDMNKILNYNTSMITTPSSLSEELFEQFIAKDVITYRNVEQTPVAQRTDEINTRRYEAGMQIAGTLFAFALESGGERRSLISDLRATLERNGIQDMNSAMDLIERAFDDLCFSQMRGAKPEVKINNVHGYEYTDDVRDRVKDALSKLK